MLPSARRHEQKENTMNIEVIKEILNPIMIFLSSGVGATVLGVIVRAIITAVSNAKNKKYAKLTDAEIENIAEKSASMVLAAIKDGVNIEADALLDKYTQTRLNNLESKFNEISSATNAQLEYARAVLGAVGDFRTISLEHKTQIQELLGGTVNTVHVEPVKTAPTPTITVNSTPEASEKKAKY